MYFTNINDAELSQYHKTVQINFKIPLTDILTSNIFKKEVIIANSIYKIYPLFYCDEITSSNSNDKIFDNKCIICTKEDDTVLNFKKVREYNANTLNATYTRITNGFCGCIYNEKLEAVKDVKLTLFNTAGDNKSVKTDENGLFYIILNGTLNKLIASYNDLTLRII